ncbi:unnamed protein product [Sympodiomycopsis kandeliae]
MADRGGRGNSRGGSQQRGNPRGGGGGGQRGGGGGQRGGGRGGASNSQGGSSGSGSNSREDKKKEVILDLAKFVDKKIRVKFQGGREVQGVLKGYDQLMNLVLDEVEETLSSANDQDSESSSPKTRFLGLTVLRGTALTVINPADGFEQIANPFASAE